MEENKYDNEGQPYCTKNKGAFRRTKIFLVSLGAFIFVASMMVVVFQINKKRTPYPIMDLPPISKLLKEPAIPKKTNNPILSNTYATTSVPLRKWCDGDEIICLNTITSTPTETMGKLAASFSTEKGKRYKIRLLVEKIEGTEPETDMETATIPVHPPEPPPLNQPQG